MPLPSVGLQLGDLRTWVRQDLADLDSTAYRWTDAVLNREIDRALARYSFVAPRLILSQVPTIGGQRLYGYPDGAWWIERVEYPIGRWPKRFVTFTERTSPLIAAPSAAPVAQLGNGTLSGTYQYAVTYVVPGGGETPASPIVSVVTAGSQVTLSGIPTGPYGVSDRRIYRTASNGSSLLLLRAVGDNTTSTITDSATDGTLTSAIPTSNTTDGIPQLELNLSGSQLPADGTGVIEVMAAYKHELDALGTTVPEKHWDAIALGAEAYALYAYLAGTNDNFEWVDGQFRDRVDDTKAPPAWLAQAQDFEGRFEARLREIKAESIATAVFPPQWGDVPVRWDRL